jgi:hypothetical protein
MTTDTIYPANPVSARKYHNNVYAWRCLVVGSYTEPPNVFASLIMLRAASCSQYCGPLFPRKIDCSEYSHQFDGWKVG